LLACVAERTLGLARFQAWALVPISIASSLIAVIIGFSLDLGLVWTALVVVAAVSLLQISYLICAILYADSPQRHQAPYQLPAKRQPLSSIQKAIAKELRVYFAPPDNIQLRAQLAILEDR
jgi:hypothetical protein